MFENMGQASAEMIACLGQIGQQQLLLELSRTKSIEVAYRALAAAEVVHYLLRQAGRLSQLLVMADRVDLEEVHTTPPGHAIIVNLERSVVRP